MRLHSLVLSAFFLVTVTSTAWCQQAALASVDFLFCSLVEASETNLRNLAGPLRVRVQTKCGRAEESYTGIQSIGFNGRCASALSWEIKATLPGQQLYDLDAGSTRAPSPLLGDTNHSVVLETMADGRQFGSEETKKPNAHTISLLIALGLKTTPI